MNLSLRRRQGCINSIVKRNGDLPFLHVWLKQEEVEEGLVKFFYE